MIKDTCVIFKISPVIAASIFAIQIKDKMQLTNEFLKILMKICSKGNIQINTQIRLFSMIYIYELEVIYDFCHLLDVANNKFNELYKTSENELSRPNSFLNNIFDFSVDLIYRLNNEGISLENVIEDIQKKFLNKNFVQKIKEEIFAPSQNGDMLKLLDGNLLLILLIILEKNYLIYIIQVLVY